MKKMKKKKRGQLKRYLGAVQNGAGAEGALVRPLNPLRKPMRSLPKQVQISETERARMQRQVRWPPRQIVITFASCRPSPTNARLRLIGLCRIKFNVFQVRSVLSSTARLYQAKLS